MLSFAPFLFGWLLLTLIAWWHARARSRMVFLPAALAAPWQLQGQQVGCVRLHTVRSSHLGVGPRIQRPACPIPVAVGFVSEARRAMAIIASCTAQYTLSQHAVPVHSLPHERDRSSVPIKAHQKKKKIPKTKLMQPHTTCTNGTCDGIWHAPDATCDGAPNPRRATKNRNPKRKQPGAAHTHNDRNNHTSS